MTKCTIKPSGNKYAVINPQGKVIEEFEGFNAKRIAQARADLINRLFYDKEPARNSPNNRSQ